MGRVLFNEVLPEALRFVNEGQDKGSLKALIGVAYHVLGSQETAEVSTAGRAVPAGSGTEAEPEARRAVRAVRAAQAGRAVRKVRTAARTARRAKARARRRGRERPSFEAICGVRG